MSRSNIKVKSGHKEVPVSHMLEPKVLPTSSTQESLIILPNPKLLTRIEKKIGCTTLTHFEKNISICVKLYLFSTHFEIFFQTALMKSKI
jgi:hypothetical protein